MKRSVTTAENVADKHSIDLDILNPKVRGEVGGDQVSAKIAKAFEDEPTVQYFGHFKRLRSETLENGAQASRI